LSWSGVEEVWRSRERMEWSRGKFVFILTLGRA
jgi:hypothetical protein